MKIVSAEFSGSVLTPEKYPKNGKPEIAFAGRSNVGKSSLLNALLNRKGLAKTSATPGKTQTINFFEINGKFYFVDLPGYGFAKVPQALKVKWDQFMAEYLRQRKPLRLTIQLVDARHAPSDKDAEMLALLDEARVPTVIVATKIDKLKRGQRASALSTIRKTLDLPDDALVIPFSAVTGEGKPELWHIIADALVE